MRLDSYNPLLSDSGTPRQMLLNSRRGSSLPPTELDFLRSEIRRRIDTKDNFSGSFPASP
jgi:hypothetical protein